MAEQLARTTPRRHDWEQRLSALIAKNLARPHAYGSWDCLLWPAEAVKAVTGRDFGRGHRGKYRSHAGAYRHLRAIGFDSAEALLDSLFAEKPIGYAQRADLVLVEMPDSAAPGLVGARVPAVCIGAEALAIFEDAAGNSGLARFPRVLWRKAWSVGA